MKTLIVANWKMNPTTLSEAKKIFNAVESGIKKFKANEVVICPPAVYLLNLTQKKVKLGGQNMFYEDAGAYTGEISPAMLKNSKCQYVIIGHSERRGYFNETDQSVNKKIKSAITKKITPILCVGETAKERDQGKTKEILKRQVLAALETVSQQKIKESGLCIAYEPRWAIGTGNACPVIEAQTIGILLQKIITQKYSRPTALKMRFLYGGSVNSKNAKDFIQEAKFQGLLIGGAALKPAEFIKIIKTT